MRSLFSIAALALAPVAHAQEAPIIVTAGLPDVPGDAAYDTVTIARDEIVTVPSGRIEEALGAIAGFQQFRRSDSRSSNPSAQGVTLRALGGNASSRALVLLDGVPQTDPFFGYVPLPALVPETLNRIVVTRGGGSGPFGAGAVAGTIALESGGPQRLGPVLASGLVNDRGGTEASLVAAPQIGSGHILAYGRWDRGPGFQTTPEDQRVAANVPARFDSVSGGARLVQRAGDTTFALAGRAFDDRRTLRFDGADSTSRGEDASLRVTHERTWAVDALAYGQWRNFTNVVVSSTRFVPVLDQKDTPSTGLGGKIEVRPPLDSQTNLRLGLDARVNEGDIAEDRFSAFSGALTGRRFSGGRTSDVGAFAELDHAFGSVVLTGGVRVDRFAISDGFFRDEDADGLAVEDSAFPDRDGWEATWRAGARFAASDALDLRAAAYRGFRLPTLNELYRPFVIFPVTTLANADLENERLTGFEAGLDWRPTPGVRLGLTAFDNRLEGAIANVTVGPDLRQRQNLDAIAARGVELDGSARLGTIRLDGSLAYTDARIDAPGTTLDIARPPQSPQVSAAASIVWEPRSGWLAGASLRHVGEQFEDDAGLDVLPAATTLGLYAQAPLVADLALVGRAENLLEEQVVTRNAGGSIDLGAPRTFWIGLRYGY